MLTNILFFKKKKNKKKSFLSLINWLARTQSSQHLHDKSFKGLVNTFMRFFDTNPIGRVLNRFSSDMGMMDEFLPITFLDFMQLFLIIAGVVLLVSILNPWIFLLTAPLVKFVWVCECV